MRGTYTPSSGFTGRLYRWYGRGFASVSASKNRGLSGWFHSKHLAYYNRSHKWDAPTSFVVYE